MISNVACTAPRAQLAAGTTGGLIVMPSYRCTQADWRAFESTTYAPQHAPVALLKRDADFAPSGTRGGGPPV